MMELAAGPGWQQRGRHLIFAAVWIVSALYIASIVDRGWGPPDEGLLGQTAERLLNGELPHQDFDEFYTGGLTLVHALAFKLLGIRLIALRAVLFAAVVLWIPLFYAVARRFAPPMLAAATTLVAVAWSVPAYPASMPSWYNLFLATAGLLGLLKYLETERYRWMFAAGLCAGLSILMKVVGLYFVAAAALLILYRQFCRPDDPPAPHPAQPSAPAGGSRSWSRWLGVAVALGLVAVVLNLVSGAHRKTPGTYVQFVVPVGALAVVVAGAAWSAGRTRWSASYKALAALGLGVAVAVLPFVLVYARHDALADLVRGVFVLPTRRLRYAVWPPRGAAILWALPLVALVAIGRRTRGRPIGGVLAALLGIVGLVLVAAGGRHPDAGGIGGEGPVYRPVVDSVATLLPIIAAAFALLMASRNDARAFAAMAVSVLCALIQFPYSNELYFHYVAPLICLSALALYALRPHAIDSRIGAVVIAFFIVFGVARVAVNPAARLAFERGGLRVPPGDSAQAAEFVSVLRAHARNGYTYATPDCPEAYFLTGLRNPTRTMYERFGATLDSTSAILALLDKHNITAVAISSWLIASRAPDPRLLAALRERYPDSAVVWHFTVRWARDAPRP